MVSYNEHDIAIIGMAVRMPEANDIEKFWENLKSGKESIREFPDTRCAELRELLGSKPHAEYVKGGYLEQIGEFEPEYFNISVEESRYMDPQHRLLLELVEEAIEDAGYSSQKMSGANVGVFTGTAKNAYGRNLDPTLPLVLVNSLESALAGRIAYTFNFFGPALNIDTACSSSLVALHYACQSVRYNECEYAVAGGVALNILPREKESAMSSPIWSLNEQVRAFAKDADGSVSGEGGAIVFLKRLDKALIAGDQIHAIIKGSAINSDGHRSNGLSAPNQYAQADVIERAFKQAGVDPLSISYIETHGTGTKLGDPIEAAGIQLAFSKYTKQKQLIPIGSLKTNIGHLNPAAGIASVVKVILALKHRQIPPSLNFSGPNPEIDFLNSPIYVNNQLTPWNVEGVRRAGISSFGLIGTNAHMILEEADIANLTADTSITDTSLPEIFTLSARHRESLLAMIDNLSTHLCRYSEQSLSDIAYTLNVGRNHFSERIAVIAHSRTELVQKLQDEKEKFAVECGRKEGKCLQDADLSPVFIYADAESPEVSIDDLLQIPIFRVHYEKCVQSGNNSLQTRYFAFAYAYTQLLQACGVKAKAVLGIGIGKPLAEVIKGKIDLKEAINAANSIQPTYTQIDSAKLRIVLEKMVKDGQNLFVVIGNRGQLAVQVQEIVQAYSSRVTVSIEPGIGKWYQNLAYLYQNGLAIEWESIYTGQSRRRISLPTYVFHRRRLFVKPADFHWKTELGETRVSEKAGDINRSEAKFSDILSIFNDAIVDEVQVEKGFEDTGGDSLGVMQIVEMLKKEYHVSIPLNLFYTVTPVQRLIEEILVLINKNMVPDSETVVSVRKAFSIESKKVEERKAKIANDTRFTKTELIIEKPENILLTGVTGFLGAHLIKDLIAETSSKIYCLVRGNSEIEADTRLKERLRFYWGNELEPYFAKRIVAVRGDLIGEHLGLLKNEYNELAKQIDSVIHSAADVRHVGNYAHLEKANVFGTQSLLNFSMQGREKVFHHMSTLAVAGYNTTNVLSEDNLEIGQEFEANVYAESKYAAEKCILLAKKQGLRASIYRIGNLVGRYSDGVFQQNIATNIFYNLLKGILILGQISPFLGNENLELLPIDICTEAIAKLTLLKEFQGNTFHLTNPNGLSIFALCELIKQMGGKIEIVDDDAFYNRCHAQVESEGFVQEVSWIFNALKGRNDKEVRERVPMKFDHSFSFAVLDKMGFHWPQIDLSFLEKLFDYTAKVGYMQFK